MWRSVHQTSFVNCWNLTITESTILRSSRENLQLYWFIHIEKIKGHTIKHMQPMLVFMYFEMYADHVLITQNIKTTVKVTMFVVGQTHLLFSFSVLPIFQWRHELWSYWFIKTSAVC